MPPWGILSVATGLVTKVAGPFLFWYMEVMDFELPPLDVLRKACDHRERRFAEEYVIDQNVKRACLAVGFKSAPPGYRMLAQENVALYVEGLLRDAGERAGIDAARVRHEMACLAFSNIFDYAQVDRDGFLEIDLSTMTRDQAAAISKVKTTTAANGAIINQTVELYDKRGALTDLAKTMGMFIDRQEVGKPGEFRGDMLEDKAKQTIDSLKGKTGVPDAMAT